MSTLPTPQVFGGLLWQLAVDSNGQLLGIGEAHRIADALLARLRSAWPNNVVACVNCKTPVPVTALNAVRCERCDDRVKQETHAFAVRAAEEARANLRACADALQRLADASDNLVLDDYFCQTDAMEVTIWQAALADARFLLARPGVKNLDNPPPAVPPKE